MIPPTLPAQVIEGCAWSDSGQAWLYADGGLCRGTGEDPTVDGNGQPACAGHRIAISGSRPGTITCVVQTTQVGETHCSEIGTVPLGFVARTSDHDKKRKAGNHHDR